jgi:uncharacterized membrane protein
MNRITTIVTGIGSLGIGAGLMYFLDPNRGNRRRALVQARVNRSVRDAGEAINSSVSQVRDRTRSVMDQSRRAVLGQQPDNRMRGALQGLLAAGGSSLALYGRKRKNVIGTVLSIAGLGMVAGGVASIPIRRLILRNREQEAIEVEKTIEIDAPLEEVYRFWSDFENLPRFLSHVRHIQSLEGGRCRWRAGDPEDIELEWDTITTSQVPNELITWRSANDAPLRASGTARFRRSGPSGTRLSVRLAYSAPGELSRKTANLLGESPLQQLDDDLVRMKKLIEARSARKRQLEEAGVPVAA